MHALAPWFQSLETESQLNNLQASTASLHQEYGEFRLPEITNQRKALGIDDMLVPATPNQKRGKSMIRRPGQSGSVVKKGRMWHGRYYADVPGQEERKRMSVPLGSIDSMTKSEAKRKLRSLLEEKGINSEAHFV